MNGLASRRAWGWLAALLLATIYVVTRAAHIGHLLVWDEAMELCTVRSFLGNGQDYFSHWFWRHPPLYKLLMMGLVPLRPGFAERVEGLNIGLGLLNAALLYQLNVRSLGQAAAAWSVVALLFLPGVLFFDLWIKADVLVTTFGLAALWALVARRDGWAGVALGFAFLSKESAVFWWVAALLLAWGLGTGRWRRVLVLCAVPAVLSGWWFVLAGRDQAASGAGLLGSIMAQVQFAGGKEGWSAAWWYHVVRWPALLGWTGLALTVAGGLLCVGTARRTGGWNGPMMWPLFLLAPAYVVLSLLPSKVVWTVITLMPAWAALAGLALARFQRLTFQPVWFEGRWRLAGAGLAVVLGVGGALLARRQDYEGLLRRVDENQWRGAHMSREAASAVNARVQPRDRLLVTSFHYWQGLAPGTPCAVFTYYLDRSKNLALLLRPTDSSFASLRADVQRYAIDWALLSPEPGAQEKEVFDGFSHALGLTPIPLSGAFLFHIHPAK